MKRIKARFDNTIDMDPDALIEHVAKLLNERCDQSRFCHMVLAGGGEFQVREDHVHFPNLEHRKCGCGKWQGPGIPCKHGLRVSFDHRLEPKDFFSTYYTGAAYKRTYSNHMHRMSDLSWRPLFDLPKTLPPTFLKLLGSQLSRGKREM